MSTNTSLFSDVKIIIERGEYQTALELLDGVSGEQAERWRIALRQRITARKAIRRKSNRRLLIGSLLVIALISLLLIAVVFSTLIKKDMASGIVCTEQHCYDTTSGAVIETPNETERVIQTADAQVVCDYQATRIALGKANVEDACK